MDDFRPVSGEVGDDVLPVEDASDVEDGEADEHVHHHIGVFVNLLA